MTKLTTTWKLCALLAVLLMCVTSYEQLPYQQTDIVGEYVVVQIGRELPSN